MKSITAACMLLFALAILTTPIAQAHSQKIVPTRTAQDLPVPPFPPGGLR